MKTLCTRLGFILCALLTGGCCPNGCFVLSGDAYRALAYSTPWYDEWEKEGASTQARHDDWIGCGGDKNGNFIPEEKILLKEKAPNESGTILARGRLFDNVLRCMRDKGYHFTGECYDNEISRSSPACGAP